MFDPGPSRHHPANPEGLAAAILKTLKLHADPCLHVRCRQSAERFAWREIGGRIEGIYEAVRS